jgi:hypothetical protein
MWKNAGKRVAMNFIVCIERETTHEPHYRTQEIETPQAPERGSQARADAVQVQPGKADRQPSGAQQFGRAAGGALGGVARLDHRDSAFVIHIGAEEIRYRSADHAPTDDHGVQALLHLGSHSDPWLITAAARGFDKPKLANRAAPGP